jgi:sugar phosphate permease
MLYALALGFFQQTIFPFARPVLALSLGMLLIALFFVLIPVLVNAFLAQSFAILCVLMSIDGYFQSYAWPNLLMLVNSQFDNKKEALILGLWSTNTNVGNIVGFVLCQYLVIQGGLDWEVAMFIIGGFVAINGIVILVGVKELPKMDAVAIKEGEPLIS